MPKGIYGEPQKVDFESGKYNAPAKKEEYPQISVKTRLGMEEVSEFSELIEIYNKYLNRKITREEFYREIPDNVLNSVLQYVVPNLRKFAVNVVLASTTVGNR